MVTSQRLHRIFGVSGAEQMRLIYLVQLGVHTTAANKAATIGKQLK